jgi:hypothetical protein
MTDLAELCGINYQSVYLTECGVFPEVLPKIKRYIVKHLMEDESKLDSDYRRFVLDKRRFFAIQFADKLQMLPDPDLSDHPFQQFRLYLDAELNRTKFAKTICIEPAGLYRMERLPLPEIPSRIREALLQVGLSSENLEELNERVNEFHARHR